MRVLIFRRRGDARRCAHAYVPRRIGDDQTHRPGGRALRGIDITDAGHLQQAFDWARPEVVIDCAGVVKSECGGHDSNYVNMVNGFVPRRIAALAYVYGCRFIQISTDCVFSGKNGARNETDECDAGYLRTYESGQRARRLHALPDVAHIVRQERSCTQTPSPRMVVSENR